MTTCAFRRLQLLWTVGQGASFPILKRMRNSMASGLSYSNEWFRGGCATVHGNQRIQDSLSLTPPQLFVGCCFFAASCLSGV